MDNNSKYVDESLIYSSKLLGIIENTPLVSRRKFYESYKPGDILVSYATRKGIELRGELVPKIISMIQRQPYSTSKILFDNNKICGYATDFKEFKRKQVLVSCNKFDYYLSFMTRGMLVRIPEMDEQKLQKIKEYMNKRIGLQYSNKSVLQNFVYRILHINFPGFKLKTYEEVDEEILNKMEPLICSTVISLALLSAGINIKFSTSPYSVWPKDFILSDSTEKICRIDI